MFVFGSYNTKDYLRDLESPAELERARLVEQTVHELGADAIALQELPGHSPRRAVEGLGTLARATGMEYLMPGRRGEDAVPALAIGHDELSVALLWQRGSNIEPIPGTLRAYEKGFWHALLVGEFEIEGHRAALASSHAPPSAGREHRMPEAKQLVQLLSPYRIVFLGQDRNSVGADRWPDGTFYDHDPQQPEMRENWKGQPPETWHPTDRRPAAILTAAGLLDAAPQWGIPAGVASQPTTGHWPGEPNGERRIDEIRIRGARVLSYWVVRNELTEAASDHLPLKAQAQLAA